MKKMNKVFGTGLSTLLVLSMVLGSTLTANAKELTLDEKMNNAYVEMLNTAKKVTITPYTGVDAKFGTETVTGEDAKVEAFWTAAENYFKLYVEKTFGADATVERIANDLSGKGVAGVNAGFELDDETYARAFKVSYKENGEAAEKLFNLHTADAKGNISIWEKTLNAKEDIYDWAMVESDDSITVWDGTAFNNLVVDYNGSKYVAYAGPTDTSTKEYDNYVSTLDTNQVAEITGNRESTNSVGTITVNDTYGTKSVKIGNTKNFGTFFDFDALDDAKDYVENHINAKSGNSCKVILNRWFTKKTLNVFSMSDWNKFWTNFGTGLLGYDIDVECYETVTDTTNVTGNHDEVGIIVTNTADVKTTTTEGKSVSDSFEADWKNAFTIKKTAEEKAKEAMNAKIEELKATPNVDASSIKGSIHGVTAFDVTRYEASYKITYNVVTSDTANKTISRDFYRANKFDYIVVDSIPAYYSEKAVTRTFTVNFYKENGTSLFKTVGALRGDDVSGAKKPTKANETKDGYVDEQTGEKVAGTLTKFTFAGWVPKGAFQVEALKDVQADMSFKASFTSEEIDPVHFFIRNDGVEQEETGSTHYDNDLYSTNVVTRAIIKFFQIHGDIGDDAVMDEIAANVIGTLPTVDDFDYNTDEAPTDLTHYIRWYVLKEESDYWHIDGVVLEKPTVTFLDEDEETEIQGKTYVNYKSNVVTPADPTKAGTEEVTYTFKGWRLADDDTMTVMTADKVQDMVVTSDLVFVAVYDEENVLPGVFENPDDEDNGEVLGEVFTNPDQSEVLGATYTQTGDMAPLFVIVALLIMSAVTISVIAMKRREN